MTDTDRTCTLFFIKHPQAGAVKTRLAEVLGTEETAELYRLFLLDMYEGLKTTSGEIHIWFTPRENDKDIRRLLPGAAGYHVQEGADLGLRMKHAFERAFAEGCDRVVLLGGDIPDFPMQLIDTALNDLKRFPAVLGPALDGGYYLIGLCAKVYQEQQPHLFEDVQWSTSSVFETTCMRLQQSGMDFTLLPEWNDVDEIQDLNVVYRLNKNSSFRESLTYKELERHRDLLREYDLDVPSGVDKSIIKRSQQAIREEMEK